MIRFFRTTGLLMGGQGSIAASVQTLLTSAGILGLNLLTGVITARFLGAAGRGEQEAMAIWSGILAQAFALGLPSSLVYNLKKEPARASQIFSAAFLSAVLAGLLATVVGLLFVPLWLNQYGADVISGAKIFMLTTPIALLTGLYTSALRASGSFAFYNFIRFLQPSVTLVSLLTLAVPGWLSPFTACLCYIVPSLPISVWLLVRVWRVYRPVWSGLGDTFKDLISYSVRSSGIDLLGTLSHQLDRALVVGLLNASSMGLYSVSLSLARTLNIFQNAASTVLFPQASGLSTEEAVDMAGRTARLSTAVTVASALLLGALGPWVLETLYGPEFRGATQLMRLLILVTVFEGTADVLAQAFMATDRPGLVTVRQGLGLLLNVPLLLVLVPRWGLMGAGISLAITSFIRLLFIVASFPRVLKVPAPRLWLDAADVDYLKVRLRGAKGRG